MDPFQRTDRSTIPDFDTQVTETRRALEGLPKQAWRKRARLQGRLGGLLLTDPATVDEARKWLARSTKAARRGGYRRLVAANGIRDATALQYAGRHKDALRRFRQTLTFIEKHRLLKFQDFALQHMGKCLAEMASWDEAHSCFMAALGLRARRGDDALVASSRAALAELERRSDSD